MPFEVLEARQMSGRNEMPASVSIRAYRGGQRPGTHIGISSDLTRKAKIKKGERFAVLVGAGEHVGLLRLKRDAKNGIVEPRIMKGGSTFNLGYVEQFGDTPREKQFTKADLIDADTIEVVLPAWDAPKRQQTAPVTPESQLVGRTLTAREQAEHESKERRKRLGLA